MIPGDYHLLWHHALVKTHDKNLGQKKAKRRRNERLRGYSFLATLGIVVIVIVASYISSLPQVEHIPDKFEFNSQAWMKYVPNPVETAFYLDYDSASALSGNPEYFGSDALLHLYQLNFSIFPQDVSYEVDIELPPPLFNGTVTVMALHNQQFGALQGAVERETKAPSFPYQGHSVRELLMRRSGDQKLLQGFLSTVDEYVIFSYDQVAGRRNVQKILDQFAFDAPSLFDNVTVRAGVYAAGVADQRYIGLQIGMFQTQLNQSQMIVKATVQDGTGILVTRSILFPSSDIALSQYGEAHRIYRDAASYKILDSWLVVAYRYPVDRLKIELSGI
jgi:hypothetical protein